MRNRRGMTPVQPEIPRLAENDTDVADGHAPRHLAFRENLILTIKVLAGFGLLGAALWGINLWTAAK